MATKAQVKRVARQQGATFDEGRDYSGNYLVSIALPGGYVWDNGHAECGVCDQTKEYDESMSEFWSAILYFIDAPVVPSRR